MEATLHKRSQHARELSEKAAADIEALLTSAPKPGLLLLKALNVALELQTELYGTLQDLRIDVGMGVKAFGRALAQAWLKSAQSAPIHPQDMLFLGLDSSAAGQIRGLLSHLCFAVQADPGVTVDAILNRPSPEEGFAPVGAAASSALPRPKAAASGEPVDEPAFLDRLDVFALEDRDWPGEASRHAPGGRSPGLRVFELFGALETANGSLAEAFRSMDIDQRGVVSFGDFHAYLVRLNLCGYDSRGSILALELFKFLDMDKDDFLSPRDCLRCFEAARKCLEREARQVEEATRKVRIRERFNVPDGSIDRIPKVHDGLTWEGMLRLSLFRRFMMGRFGSLMAGLRRMDIEGNGYVSKPDFVYELLSLGYCVSGQEAEDLFAVLDINGLQTLNLQNLEAMERANLLCGPEAIHSESPLVSGGARVPAGVGSGGLFSDAGRLGEADYYTRSPRSYTPRSQRPDPDDNAQRLHGSPTESWSWSHPASVGKRMKGARQETFPKTSVLKMESTASTSVGTVSIYPSGAGYSVIEKRQPPSGDRLTPRGAADRRASAGQLKLLGRNDGVSLQERVAEAQRTYEAAMSFFDHASGHKSLEPDISPQKRAYDAALRGSPFNHYGREGAYGDDRSPPGDGGYRRQTGAERLAQLNMRRYGTRESPAMAIGARDLYPRG